MATTHVTSEEETIVLQSVHRLLSTGKRYLRILVTGRTGAGKSALVNSIVGEYVAVEGVSPNRVTTEVTKYEKKVQDVIVTIYDSPGLQDGTADEIIERQYLDDLADKCNEVDLVLYCIRMNDRFSEFAAIKKLSFAFGMNKFWQSTLFVLTFANDITLPKTQTSYTSLPQYFRKQMSDWKHILHQIALISEVGIDREIAENVPIIPAGYSSEPYLPATDCDYWLSKLWFQCLERTADDAKPLLLKINWSRLQTSKEAEAEIKNTRPMKGYQLPIIRDIDTGSYSINLESLISEIRKQGWISEQG